MTSQLRFLSVLAAGLLATACLGADEPAPKPDTAPSAKGGYPFEAEVNADRVRVRAGGNVNERELTVLAKGDRVAVVDEQYGWYRIHCPQGCKAWVNAKYTSEIPAAGAEWPAGGTGAGARGSTQPFRSC